MGMRAVQVDAGSYTDITWDSLATCQIARVSITLETQEDDIYTTGRAVGVRI